MLTMGIGIIIIAFTFGRCILDLYKKIEKLEERGGE